MKNTELPRELYEISSSLENYWITRIKELETKGRSYGDAEYDNACSNFCSVAAEFWIWDE